MSSHTAGESSAGLPGGPARRRGRWVDRALSLLVSLVALLLIAPVVGGLIDRNGRPLAAGPSVTAPNATSSGPDATAPPACARETLIGVLAKKRTVARRAPASTAKAVQTFDRITALGSRQVFLLEQEVRGGDGASWFRALLPVRPNGTTGFIAGKDLQLRTTPYRLEVDRRRFTLKLFEGCRLVQTYRVGIGTGDTPTPRGRFYLTSLIALPDPHTIYGPFAYGLSGYSDVLDTWRLGGIIGLHGTNDPSSIGRRSSHGCIRMRNQDIRQLVQILPLGTPIRIYDSATSQRFRSARGEVGPSGAIGGGRLR